MKKKSFFCGLIITVGLLLSACHGRAGLNAFEVPDEFDTSKKYEITFWAKNDTNMEQTEVYKSAIKNFESIYPNIKVNLRLYTDYGRIYNDVITNISTGTTPNVCITYPDHIATYMTGMNVVVPLDDVLVNPKYGLGGSEVLFDAPSKDEIVPKFLNECSFFGSYYALPFMRSTEACYINETFVNKLGYEVPDILTWDYIFEVSEAALAKDKDGNYAVNGQKVLIPFIYKSTDNMMISYLKQKNAGYSDDEGNVLIFNDETTDFLNTVASHAGTGAFSTFKISSYPANFLDAGQCLFAIDSTAGATWMGSKAPLSDIAPEKIVDFNTVVRPIPQCDPSSPKMISQGPSICIFNKEDPQEVLASWLFTQYLLSNDVQIAYSKTEGYVPVTLKAQNSDEYVDYLNREGEDGKEHYSVKLQAVKLLIDNTENTFITSVFNGSASLRDAAGALVENVTKAKKRNIAVDDAFIRKNYDEVTSLYRLNQISMNKTNPGNTASSKTSLGPLPSTSITLLVILGIAWIGIIAYVAIDYFKKRNTK